MSAWKQTMKKINSVDVARLSSAQVTTLLAMGKTRPSPRENDDPRHAPRHSLEALDEDARNLLLADLQGPVISAESGPLSFIRLAGIDPAAAAPFAGQSFLKVLTSSRTGRVSLELVSSYGQILESPALPTSTRLAGSAIVALASLALHTRFGAPLDKSEAATAAALVQSLAKARNAATSRRGNA